MQVWGVAGWSASGPRAPISPSAGPCPKGARRATVGRMREKLPLVLSLCVGALLAYFLLSPSDDAPRVEEGSEAADGRQAGASPVTPPRPERAEVANAAPAEVSGPDVSPVVAAALDAMQPVAWEPTHDGIDSGMGDLQPAIDLCFAAWRAEEPDANGEISLRLRATGRGDGSGEGRLELLELRASGAVSPTFGRCLEQSLSVVRLAGPPEGGDMDFDYPMNLGPR